MHFLTIKSKKYIIQDIILTKYHYTTTPKHTQVQPLILSIMREIFLNFLSFLTELPELPERNFLNFLSFLQLPKVSESFGSFSESFLRLPQAY